jgi:hypothetical protein
VIELIGLVQDEIRKYFTFQYEFIGSVKRNMVLKEEIEDLKSGLEAIEELARNDLGFIKPGETFYRVLPRDSAGQNKNSSLPKSD